MMLDLMPFEKTDKYLQYAGKMISLWAHYLGVLKRGGLDQYAVKGYQH